MEQYNVLEAAKSCTLFPVRTELPFENNTAYLSGYSCLRSITFVQNSSIQVNRRRTISLVRKLSVLEAGGSSTIFPCEN
jgi:hypothetical protein